MTLNEIITSSLRLAGVIQQSEASTDYEYNLGLENLRLLLSTWSVMANLVWRRDTQTFTADGASNELTLTARPVRIYGVVWSISDAVVYSLPSIDDGEYYRSSNKLVGLPRSYFWDHQHTIRTLGLASAGTQVTVVYQPDLMDLLADLDAELELPPGYETALKSNLAMLITSEFNREPSQVLAGLASSSLEAIRQQNQRIPIIRGEAGAAVNSATTRGTIIPRGPSI